MRVIVIGAGPAGLTAALELLKSGQATPVILEASHEIGGISRTVNFKGNRMDIGGHRFFSKSDWVMKWWREILPVDLCQDSRAGRVMLVRNRLSRIYFLRKYFDYPIKINYTTLRNLGLYRLFRIGISYFFSIIYPRKNITSLEDFFVNRFGAELYRTFFKDYTEKVWGVPCNQISAEWGAQRIKGLSVIEALRHAVRQFFRKGTNATKTSLIEKFLYPRLGPGQLWEEVANLIRGGGGEIRFGQRVSALIREGDRIVAVRCIDDAGRESVLEGDYVISSMPVRDLVLGISPQAPDSVRSVADALPYRDFITVGLLVSEMRPNSQAQSYATNNMPPDNWIYIQERDVRIGRLQIFNNWSPSLVSNPQNIWLGLEYFCQEGDDLWCLNDEDIKSFAVSELVKIGMVDIDHVLDGTVIRVPKAYPAYFGSYSEFSRLREWVDCIENLFLVGRNGMHRYNNQDHSMLTARLAVQKILTGSTSKDEIWNVNVDDDYHEED